MSNNDKDKNKESKELKDSSEYIEKYLQETDVSSKVNYTDENDEDNSESENREKVLLKGSESKKHNFIEFSSDILPLSIFYDEGTKILVRKADIKEIQAFSMVNDKFYYDIIDKMNSMIASCVRIKTPSGEIKSYLNIKDGDRFFLIYLIRELTFNKGNNVKRDVECDCGNNVSINMHRDKFNFFEIDDKIKEYFDESEKAFYFETINDEVFKIAPPTIGIQKSFNDYIIEQIKEKKEVNLSFLKIIPFTLINRTNISEDGIKKKLKDFQNSDKMDDDSFQFLNSAIDKMLFGIKSVSTTCDCGIKIEKDFSLPKKVSSLFVKEDAFNKFIKKK